MTRVYETRDPARLRALLQRDKVAGAYLLGDLNPRYLGACRFYVAEAGGQAAVALVYEGLSVPALLTFGDAALTGALLADPAVALPATCHVHLLEAHRPAVEARYALASERRMVRMALPAGAIRPGPPRTWQSGPSAPPTPRAWSRSTPTTPATSTSRASSPPGSTSGASRASGW